MRSSTSSIPSGCRRCSTASRRRSSARTPRSRRSAPVPTAAAPSLVGRVGQHMLRRAIQLVLGARHGGLILVADVADGGPLRRARRTQSQVPLRPERAGAPLPDAAPADPRPPGGGDDQRLGRLGGLRGRHQPRPRQAGAGHLRDEPRRGRAGRHRRRRGPRQVVRAARLRRRGLERDSGASASLARARSARETGGR